MGVVREAGFCAIGEEPSWRGGKRGGEGEVGSLGMGWDA